MIINFKIFESIWDLPNSELDTPDGFKRCLSSHIAGHLPIVDSYKLVESCQCFFNWKIPNNLKYQGEVYRVMQFYTKENYLNTLKKGLIPLKTQRYYSCSKNLGSIEYVKGFTSHKNFKYFITFKFNVTYNDVLFDMNKMNDYLNQPDSYHEENEIVVLTLNLHQITKDHIIDHGKLI